MTPLFKATSHDAELAYKRARQGTNRILSVSNKYNATIVSCCDVVLALFDWNDDVPVELNFRTEGFFGRRLVLETNEPHRLRETICEWNI